MLGWRGNTRRGGPQVRERDRALRFASARSDLAFNLTGLLDGRYTRTCNGVAIKNSQPLRFYWGKFENMDYFLQKTRV